MFSMIRGNFCLKTGIYSHVVLLSLYSCGECPVIGMTSPSSWTTPLFESTNKRTNRRKGEESAR